MNRREALVAAAATLGLTTEASAAPVTPKGVKGYLVVTLEVGYLPPYKAEAFMDRVKDSMRKKIPVGWEAVVRPTRVYGDGKIEVFVVDEDSRGDLRAIEALIYDTKQDRLLSHNRVEQYAEEELERIHDYVRLMLGSPVIKLPGEGLEELIDFFIERGQHYNVNNLQAFVLEGVQASTCVVDDNWVPDESHPPKHLQKCLRIR